MSISSKLDFYKLKSEINLIAYAKTFGYQVDKSKSSRHSVALRLDNQDKIIVSRRNGLWMYFSVYDDQDNGTVIDFLCNREGITPYQAGVVLNEWQQGYSGTLCEQIKPLEEQKPEPARIKRLYQKFDVAQAHPYLLSRGISQETLLSDEFTGRVLMDVYGNAVFPHYHQGGVCGLELKGPQTSLFVRGSQKTFWRSNYSDNQTKLLIAESAIDAMSYYQLFGIKNAFWIATCGGISPLQRELLKRLLRSANGLREISLITDNNQGGDRLVDALKNDIEAEGFQGKLGRHSPSHKGQDWNDVLLSEPIN